MPAVAGRGVGGRAAAARSRRSAHGIGRALKEWAYAGFTFMWIAAVVAHYLAGDGTLSLLPVVLLGSLAVSYVTRSASRGGSAKELAAP